MNLFDKYKTMARDTVTARENITKTPIDISSAEYSKSLKEEKNIPQVPLDNPSAEYSKTAMDIMKRKYSSLIQWLREYPVTDEDILDGATWLYVRIQDTIRILDACMIAEDLQGFDRAIEKLKSQYLEAVNRLINW